MKNVVVVWKKKSQRQKGSRAKNHKNEIIGNMTALNNFKLPIYGFLFFDRLRRNLKGFWCSFGLWRALKNSQPGKQTG
jgi:hypothetical protein